MPPPFPTRPSGTRGWPGQYERLERRVGDEYRDYVQRAPRYL